MEKIREPKIQKSVGRSMSKQNLYLYWYMFIWMISVSNQRTALRNHSRILLLAGHIYWKISSFQQARVEDTSTWGGGGQNKKKYRYEARKWKMFFKNSLDPGQNRFWGFWLCLAQIFFILFPPPTLKYPLHSPAEKSLCFSEYNKPIKSFRLWLCNTVEKKFNLNFNIVFKYFVLIHWTRTT